MEQLSSLMKNYFQHKKAEIMGINNFARFAIFVPIIEQNGEYHFVFQVRSKFIKQPGEISFPGGKVDETDLSTKDAAIRELQEELGVDMDQIELLGELDYMITPFHFALYPFIGTLASQTKFHLNPDEVEDIFFAPVSQMMKMTPKEHPIHLQVSPSEDFPYHLIPNGENYNWRTTVMNEKFYEYEGHVIWGLTATILSHALEELRKASKG
ncbi:coenzyme A pyrophosphatase [Salipaludibacillus neizhouensis]|uniref:Coenzyme A pyrophosphatase n=1 Tax=Salipaludibacillus neizhouensis TaxID=885475 RepID=A0A3A9K6E1_9BACI|nr:CoA pyrophosphatase [Salipaludibacillus neizhouensis]RKL68604.1 coenzyme A pyrophosphatase [Salipaludibacillus neizhouensis]